MSLHTLANHLQSAGRGEDSVLIHMTPKEVQGLQSLAMAHGGSLTINPETGLAEAGFLSSLLPMLAGAALTIGSGGALSPLAASMMVGGAGALATGSLSKGLMMGLGAYGGAGLGAGLAAAGAGAAGTAAASAPVTYATSPFTAAAPTAAGSTAGAIGGANLGQVGNPFVNPATNPAQALATSPAPVPVTVATTDATGQSIFSKFSQAGRGLGNILGGGPEGESAREQFAGQITKPQMYSAGLSAVMTARQEQQDAMDRAQREANRPTGPFKPKYEYDSGYNPTAMSPTLSGERTYFSPSYNPVRAAGGGMMGMPMQGGAPVEQMSNLNSIGANTRFPMANQITSGYATAAQRPISENVLTPMTNYNLDPYSGEQRFAEGGIAALAYAEGGKTMTLAEAVKEAKAQGISTKGLGTAGLANALGATITSQAGTAMAKGPVSTASSVPSAARAQELFKAGDKAGAEAMLKAAAEYIPAATAAPVTSAPSTGGGTTPKTPKVDSQVGALLLKQAEAINARPNPFKPGTTKTLSTKATAGLESIAQQQADAVRKPVTFGGKTYEPTKTNEIDVPDLSSKQLAAYTKLPALEDLAKRFTGLDRLTVDQKTQLANLIKDNKVTNSNIENIVNDWTPRRDEEAYLGLATLPTELGGKGKQPIFGEPPEGTTATGEYVYDPVTKNYTLKSDKSNIYISDKVRDITSVKDLDPVTMALYGRKANLSDFANYDTKKLGQKLSLADIYYDMSKSPQYEDFLSGQELAYINKYSASPAEITSIYRDLFGKAPPANVFMEYGAMTPDKVRQALINTPEYEERLNKGIKPDIEYDEAGNVVIPGAINRTVTTTADTGSAYTGAPIVAAPFQPFTPAYAGGKSGLEAIIPQTSSVTPSVSSAFTPNYSLSPVQNALAPAFTPSSVFTLPSVSTQPITNKPLVSTGALPTATNPYQSPMNAISAFNPFTNLTPDQLKNLTPEQYKQYMSMLQSPVGSNVFSAGTYNAFPMASGGMAQSGYNLGGYSDGGRLLKGPGDGVSDSIPASIGNRQPARLADGEFVVPARIVSEIGNGSTDAGARKLYAMMDRVQRARSKTVGKGKVAVNSKADRLLPV